jgi:hypothetical protein
MFELLWMLLTYNVSSFQDLMFFGLLINNNIIYKHTPDYFPVIYSLITKKGDCYNYASLFNLFLKIKGINSHMIKVDYDCDNKLDHVIVLVNDSIGCYYCDVTNMDFYFCSNYPINFCSK